LVIKALDPYWIRIRIGIQPKMLDPDPDEMMRIRNPDLHHRKIKKKASEGKKAQRRQY
jgi:hypothetical protein